MKFRRRRKDDARLDVPEEPEHGSKKKERNRKKELSKGAADPELAARLREYGENYGLEEDPYLEGLSNAIEEGKNLAIWASNDVMTLMPHPDVESVEGPVYSALVLVRNVLVFVPVALTWLAVGKATTGFAVYTARSSAASVVNFLQFWQNGYGVLAKVWTLSHIAEDDFYIIGTVILLTFITPFMNRSAVKKAAAFEQDALRERLTLVIEVESFLFDKRRLTPLSIDSALTQSLERIVEATRNSAIASKRIETGLISFPRQIELDGADRDHGNKYKTPYEPANGKQYVTFDKAGFLHEKGTKEDLRWAKSSADLVNMEKKPVAPEKPEYDPREAESIDRAANSLEAVAKHVDVIVESLPRRSHARKELKKVEIELAQTREELQALRKKLKKKKKREEKKGAWKAAKREAERNKALGKSLNLRKDALQESERE